MIPRTIPIASVKPTDDEAFRMAVRAIEDYLRQWYQATDEELSSTGAARIVAGRWYGRVPGFHSEDDFLLLVRDMLLFLQGGGERSSVSDQLGFFLSGFMPTYGAACAVLKVGLETGDWREMQAFMHAHGYGNARAYVEDFDWAAGQNRLDDELFAWRGVLQSQVDRIAELRRPPPPVQLAFYKPSLPPGVLAPAPTPAPGPLFKPAPPPLPSTPPALEPAPIPEGVPRLPPRLPPVSPWLIRGGLVLLEIWMAREAFKPIKNLNEGEGDWMRQQQEALKNRQLKVRDIREIIEAIVNDPHSQCLPQREINQVNGAKCENDGYALMEQVMLYQRLVDPPKSRGLDGLFEKLAPADQPYPLPDTTTVPERGRILFIPDEARPPACCYDFKGDPKRPIYPKFVVFEAKNIAARHDADEPNTIKKTAKGRLGLTCDGAQMGEKWSDARIPQALNRQYPKAKDRAMKLAKRNEIRVTGYARWIFACLPGDAGEKLFVFIDVATSDLDLDNIPAKPRKTKPPTDKSY